MNTAKRLCCAVEEWVGHSHGTTDCGCCSSLASRYFRPIVANGGEKKIQRLHPSPTGMFESNPVGSPAVEADRGGTSPPPKDWQHNTYINALNVLTVFS